MSRAATIARDSSRPSERPQMATAPPSVGRAVARTGGSRPSLAHSLQSQRRGQPAPLPLDQGAGSRDVAGELRAAIEQVPIDSLWSERRAKQAQRAADVEGLAREDSGVERCGDGKGVKADVALGDEDEARAT